MTGPEEEAREEQPVGSRETERGTLSVCWVNPLLHPLNSLGHPLLREPLVGQLTLPPHLVCALGIMMYKEQKLSL